MDSEVYEAFRRLILDKAGINLGNGRQALVHARLGKRLRALGLTDYYSYLDYVNKDKSGEEIVQLLDVISTNTTSFFREGVHFTFLEELIREWARTGKRKFRIWCAAASTGEEPYTLSMVIQDALHGHEVDLRILSTDISTKVLRLCKQGHYTCTKLESVPDPMRRRYFTETSDPEVMSANATLRAPLTFARLNLMESPYPMKGPFDVVFCRNVMIYFDREGRSKFVSEAVRLLAPGGYLITGHSESLTGISQGLKTVKPSIYQKPI